jgi:hypothetical protein
MTRPAEELGRRECQQEAFLLLGNQCLGSMMRRDPRCPLAILAACADAGSS